MTRKTISRGLALAVVLAGIFGLSRWMRPTPLPPVALTESKTPPPSKVLPASPAPAPPLPVFGTAAFAAMAKERGAAWVGGRNRDAVSLLALWDMTDDENVLR